MSLLGEDEDFEDARSFVQVGGWLAGQQCS